MNNSIVSRILFVVVVMFVSAHVSGTVYAQYATPTPTPDPANCHCTLSTNNCYDPVPGSGTDCSEVFLGCGQGIPPCDPDKQLSQSFCGVTYCGARCILDQICSTGFCQSNPPAITCDNPPLAGTYLCGDKGCGLCERNVGEITCNGSHCESLCKFDEVCGASCPVPTGGATATPGGGPNSSAGELFTPHKP